MIYDISDWSHDPEEKTTNMTILVETLMNGLESDKTVQHNFVKFSLSEEARELTNEIGPDPAEKARPPSPIRKESTPVQK